jgi:hypothetical protein
MLENKILVITRPEILLDEMSLADFESANAKVDILGSSPSKKQGSLLPMVQVNGHLFTENELSSLSMDMTGFYPTVRIGVVSSDGLFMSTAFPKDGDVVSVFIRSKKDEFKPIRCDFEITGVNSFPSTDDQGEVNSFVINGVLRVPGYFTDHCKSFSKMTSYDALLGIAQDLKLGFATNEIMTNDKMTWLCAFDTYEKFIEDTLSAAYKDDDSFFAAWFDHHYHLNFVNVNNQFSETDKNIDDTISTMSTYDFSASKGTETITENHKLLLSNHPNLKGSPMYIERYTILNKAGTISIENGYRRQVQYYDAQSTEDPANRYASFFIEPMNTKGVKDKILLRGRPGEDFVFSHNKYKYMGKQDNSNMHENFLFAKIQNWQNLQELEKMKLHTISSQCNFNLYRGQRVPIVITVSGNPKKMEASRDDDEPKGPVTFDRFLSGYYYISGMKYTWEAYDSVFRQELYLSRREWPIPPQAKRAER